MCSEDYVASHPEVALLIESFSLVFIHVNIVQTTCHRSVDLSNDINVSITGGQVLITVNETGLVA